VSAIYLHQFPSYSSHDCKIIVIFTYPGLHFLFALGRPCGNHAKRCMNEKTIQCLPNPSQHVPIYLQQFPSYSNRKCKKNCSFHVPQPTLLFPLEQPLQLSPNMFHRWKDNSMLAKPLAASTYQSSIVSGVIRCLSQYISPKIAIFTTFWFPLWTPLGQSR